MRCSLALALVVSMVSACGGKKASTTPGGDGSGTGSGEVITAQMLLGWGTQGYNPESATPKTNVFLEVTDHHGQMQSYPLGDISAPCAAAAGNGEDIITTLRCLQPDGTGAEFRAVYRGGVEIIVLRRWVTPADDPADIELSFQEVSRIPVPTGSKVKPAA